MEQGDHEISGSGTYRYVPVVRRQAAVLFGSNVDMPVEDRSNRLLEAFAEAVVAGLYRLGRRSVVAGQLTRILKVCVVPKSTYEVLRSCEGGEEAEIVQIRDGAVIEGGWTRRKIVLGKMGLKEGRFEEGRS